MSECVARRAAAVGSLILPAAPAASHHPGSGGKTGSGGPINIISPEGKIAAAVCYEFKQLGQLDDAVLLASAEPGRNLFRSIESVSLAAAYDITNDNMIAIRIPHMRRSDIADLVAGDAHPANGSRTAVARRCA